MNNNPFDELRIQLDLIQDELTEIKSVISGKQQPTNKPFLNLTEACEYTGLSKSTLYRLTSQKQIPHLKRGKLLFNRVELTEWINSAKQSQS